MTNQTQRPFRTYPRFVACSRYPFRRRISPAFHWTWDCHNKAWFLPSSYRVGRWRKRVDPRRDKCSFRYDSHDGVHRESRISSEPRFCLWRLRRNPIYVPRTHVWERCKKLESDETADAGLPQRLSCCIDYWSLPIKVLPWPWCRRIDSRGIGGPCLASPLLDRWPRRRRIRFRK